MVRRCCGRNLLHWAQGSLSQVAGGYVALEDSDGLQGGVGAVTAYGPDDTLASFSNWGTLVDLIAPGVSSLIVVEVAIVAAEVATAGHAPAISSPAMALWAKLVLSGR